MTKIRNYELYVTTTGLTWEMVFNANFINYGWFGDAYEIAKAAGYPYIAFNDLVYRVRDDGWSSTDFTTDDIK